MNRHVKRFCLLLLAVCFTASTASASYHNCVDMEPPAPAQEMAEMDCHKDMNAPAPAEKKCCVEFSCPKCFSSPLTSALVVETSHNMLFAALIMTPAYDISRHSSDVPYKPPKIG